MMPTFFLLLATLALGFAVYALFSSLQWVYSKSSARHDASDGRSALLEQKQALVRSLRDLEFDRDSGKVSADDFALLNQNLRNQAKDVLRKLDDDVSDFREEAMKEISSVAPAEAEPAPEPKESAEQSDAKSADSEIREAAQPDAEKRTCAACETANDADAKFCKKCGAAL